MVRILLAALAVAGCAASAVPQGPEPGSRASLAGAPEIVDGDTLDIGEVRVRLHGIDAPERAQRCGPPEARWDCGRAATAALARLAGARVVCTPVERDRYGRVIAECRAGGRDLGAAMVAGGWALAYRRFSEAHVPAERAARAAGLGVWRGPFVPPWDWRDGVRLAAAGPERARAARRPGCSIKGNVSGAGRIYHLPGSRHYARTRIDPASGERWFCSEAEARSAGWRAPRG